MKKDNKPIKQDYRKKGRDKAPEWIIPSATILLTVGILVIVTIQFRNKEEAPPSQESSVSVAASVAPPDPSPSEDSPESEDPAVTAERDMPYYEAELPLLVNFENPIPEGYDPELRQVADGYYYDAHAADALDAMMQAAKEEGIILNIVSAYRSTEKQTTNYNNKIQEYIDSGYTEEEAVVETLKYIAYPGTSEHSIGLAVDLNSLYEDFEYTDEYQWLISHCAEYGFILRYPKDKTEITQINYEPWHYRYVGSNHAEVIMAQGICLEEYLLKYGGE